MRCARNVVLLAAVISAMQISPPCRAAEPAEKPASAAPAEASIREALPRKISVEFIDTPLVDVIGFLVEKCDVQMLLDRKGLADAGIDTNSPITLKAKELPLRSVLALILDQVNGTCWTIRHDVMQITMADKANAQLSTKTYILHELLGPELAKEYDTARLVSMIMSHVAPEAWQPTGGLGAINAVGSEHPVLVVTQSWRNHEAINDLLAQLRGTQKPKPAPAVPAIPPTK